MPRRRPNITRPGAVLAAGAVARSAATAGSAPASAAGGTTVATVSRRWFRVRDTYGVEIGAAEDDALLLAVVVVIDMMAHPGR